MKKSALLLAPLVLLLALLSSGCPEDAPAPAAAAPPAQATSAPAVAAPPASETRGRPLPEFDGVDLAGAPLSMKSFLGRRFLLFGFNPELPNARMVATAVRALQGERTAANFQIVGMSMASTVEATSAFAKNLGLDFPTFFDANAEFMNKLGLRSAVWVLLVDADGNVIGGSDYFATDAPDAQQTIEHMLRDYLRLPHAQPSPADPDGNPPAPDFTAQRLDGGEPLALASLRGKPVILMFFLYTCPHCHSALEFLKGELKKLGDDARPKLIGVSTYGGELTVRQELKSKDIDIFDAILADDDLALRRKYAAFQGVPVIVLIDAQGRIRARTNGWREDRDPPLTRMRLAQLAGKEPPMLLSQSGYSGNEFCAVCHAEELHTWRLTQHATALTTLAKQGADGRSECVTCHVVGYGKPGGYSIARPEKSLEDVGCETCHGRGGPHLSPGHVPASGSYEQVCVTCHTKEHSLGFDYAKFLPRVSHAALAKLSPEEARAFLAAHGKPRDDLLPANVASVGSEKCASCHAAEHAKWAAHPHARVNPPVGCETCHGGGADHVAEGAVRKGSITSLADKCGSCAMTQLCGSCHTSEKEPDFQFRMKEKIEHQRHSDRPLQGLVQNTLPASTVVGLIDSALAARER